MMGQEIIRGKPIDNVHKTRLITTKSSYNLYIIHDGSWNHKRETNKQCSQDDLSKSSSTLSVNATTTSCFKSDLNFLLMEMVDCDQA